MAGWLFLGRLSLGGPSGILSAVAIGIAVAVALFSDTKGACSRPFRRRG
jgi:hypothetical protein